MNGFGSGLMKDGRPKKLCDAADALHLTALPEPLEEAVPLAVFKAEVAAWARRIGVEPRELHVRAMRRKWASCSTRGRVTFDADLLRQSAKFRAEVVAHELLHLRVPNHGKVFKAMLRTHLARGQSETMRAEQPLGSGDRMG